MADPLHDCALVIMAKAPCAGRVKTRLEPAVPPDALVALYRCLIEDTVALARQTGVFVGDGCRRVIAFNGDTPHLPPDTLAGAFPLLARHDLVVGPTEDGGYYLVGARRAHGGLFAADGLGTGGALRALLARAAERGLGVALTEAWYDVDEGSDLARLGAELRRTPARAPRTAAWLAAWNARTP